jgi:hypothetical protein
MSIGKAIRLFLVDGTPTGLLTAEITNWTGHVLVAPRSRIQEAFRRPEANKTGVYFLVGEELGRAQVYVGEGDCIAERVKSHARDQDKQFWERVFLVTSKDFNLTKAHVRYLESRLVQIIQASGRAECVNGNQPAQSILPEADISDMEYFLGQLQILLPSVGLDFLRSPVPKKESDVRLDDELTDRDLDPQNGVPIPILLSHPTVGVDARGYELDGEVIVLAGSFGTGKEYKSNSYAGQRQALIKEGKVRVVPSGQIEFTADVTFKSPSAAAAVLNNCNSNGRSEWKLASNGMSLGTWWTSQLEKANTLTNHRENL